MTICHVRAGTIQKRWLGSRNSPKSAHAGDAGTSGAMKDQLFKSEGMKRVSRRAALRSFLAAPLAGRAAVAEVTKTISGVPVVGAPQLAGTEDSLVATGPSNKPWFAKGLDLLRGTIKPWKEAEFKLEYGEVRELDPDLAAMQSLSLTTKFRLQRDRQLEQARKHTWLRVWIEEERYKEGNE